ncbi:transcriptional protein SWT1 [Anoplophora glabripennis]|uniref:transcriptional protein SWT1 n=1 Tax=Anoplophora glabripennis TaxID=217634 RepID=UPI0008746267|nr:transcriptional protein SWT1 [Anoplophora glabripennis]
MSLVPKEDRPKLKAKRFSKFEPSSSIPKTEEQCTFKEDTNNIPNRGHKRIGANDDTYSFKPKRICTAASFNAPPPHVKNLAHNRLKKLREEIQANANSEGFTSKNKSNFSTKSILHPNNNGSIEKSPTKSIKTHTDFTYPHSLQKNLAADRLKNIKSKLKEQDDNKIVKSQSSPALQKTDTDIKNSVPYQLASQTLDVNINQENTSGLVKSSSNNFVSKMEMTASWVKTHQDQSSFHTCIESPASNLPVTIKQSQDTTKIDEGSDDMEWTNAEPDDEVVDPNKNETEVSKQEEEVKEIIKDPEKIKNVCIIVDTNVFIWGLSKIRDILNLKTTESFKPIIYVPWMVITELDYMKDSCSDAKLLKSVVNAIKFINAALENNNHRVVGQTIFDVERQKHVGTSPDDKIIACCLQATEKYETVMLLSNDINLKNKAMINDIAACSANEIMMKLMSKLGRNTKYQKIMNKLGIMCSSIICDCMKAAYGDVWLRMDLMSYPPWSLIECLKRFKKYWSAVFRDKLLKQFVKTLQDLQNAIEKNKYIRDDSEDFEEFMKLCITLCVFLKNIEESRGFVENTLAQITKMT